MDAIAAMEQIEQWLIGEEEWEGSDAVGGRYSKTGFTSCTHETATCS